MVSWFHGIAVCALPAFNFPLCICFVPHPPHPLKQSAEKTHFLDLPSHSLLLPFWVKHLQLSGHFFFFLIYLFVYFIWLCQVLATAWGLHCSTTCGIIVPWPQIKPASPALEGGFFFFFFVVDFVIHWNETAMGLHVFPIPIPLPASLSTRSL